MRESRKPKNNDGRVLALSAPLAALIERRWRARGLGCPFVFHANGRPIGDWRKTWAKACVAAGFYRTIRKDAETELKVPTKLFHDLRRTVVRNLVRAGVAERAASRSSTGTTS